VLDEEQALVGARETAMAAHGGPVKGPKMGKMFRPSKLACR
jgi:hypothetical protein